MIDTRRRLWVAGIANLLWVLSALEVWSQRGADMQQHQREKREAEIEMRVPQQRVHAIALRQRRWNPDIRCE